MQAQNFAQLAQATQPMLGHAPHCGDGVWHDMHDDGLFGFLCDAAGHGEAAEVIQQQATHICQQHALSKHIDLIQLFQQLHQQLKGSRGMVAIAFLLNDQGDFDYIHIGDVSMFCLPRLRSSEQQGVIGYHMPTPKIKHWQCALGSWLVIHSDGIHRSTPTQTWLRFLTPDNTPRRAILQIMQQLTDGRDDASCLVLRFFGKNQRATINIAKESL